MPGNTGGEDSNDGTAIINNLAQRGSAPAKYLKECLPPLHLKTITLFDSLKNDDHHVAMNNRYNSAAFCKAVYNNNRKVCCHGTAHRYGQNTIPTSKSNLQGTTTATILEEDHGCPHLIISSTHDIKPIHYLDRVSGADQWVEKESKVYFMDSIEVESLKVLWWLN